MIISADWENFNNNFGSDPIDNFDFKDCVHVPPLWIGTTVYVYWGVKPVVHLSMIL